MRDGLAQAYDSQGGEHVACAAEEAVDCWDVDFEDSWGKGGGCGGADDGHFVGGRGEADGGYDYVGDAVGCVEFCDGGFEGGEGGYFGFGKESDDMVVRCVYGEDWRWAYSASNWFGRIRSASRNMFL